MLNKFCVIKFNLKLVAFNLPKGIKINLKLVTAALFNQMGALFSASAVQND